MATSNGAASAAAAAITHCLFDVDGLLLDTETAYTDAQRQVLEEIEPGLGASFTWELKSKMMGEKRKRVFYFLLLLLPLSNLSSSAAHHFPPLFSKLEPGRTSLAAGQVLIDALDLQNKHGVDAAEFVRRREEVLVTLFPHTRAMPGAARLVAHLKASGVPVAVATSSHRAHFELKSKNHGGIFENFEHVVTGCTVRCVVEDDRREKGREREGEGEKVSPLARPASSLWPPTLSPFYTHTHSLSFSSPSFPALAQNARKTKNSKGKPHPEIFELAASKFDPPPASPANVLVFEDAPVGVEAALAAGMRCVFVPDERTPKGEAHSRACVVLGSLDDFDPTAWGLPAWKS